jgi:hypothetical protein
MKKRKTKLIHSGHYVAEVKVDLIESDDPWSPYLSMDDSLKLDTVRDALRKKDFKTASKYGRIFRLEPLK